MQTVVESQAVGIPEQSAEPPSAADLQKPPVQLAIRVYDLHKTYGEKKAVDGISFSVAQGEIFGILGPNGAGKSTTLEMVEGLRDPDSRPGTSIVVGGLNVLDRKEREEVHQRIGLQLQTSTLFDELTVRENLDMLAMLYRKTRPVPTLVKEFDLESKAKERLDGLSGGQKQRVSLAAALVNDPDILLLDEPSTGLDPQARRNVWDTVRRFQQQGRTVVITTHYMEEAEVLCDRVAIVEDGKIVALGTPQQLIEEYVTEQSISVRLDGRNPVQQAQEAAGSSMPVRVLSEEDMSSIPGVTGVTRTAAGYNLRTKDLAASISALADMARQRAVRVAELVTRPPSLEDVFLALTGREYQSGENAENTEAEKPERMERKVAK